MPDEYLTIAEIAERLNLSELWVGRLIKRGTFAGAKKHRGSWIVPSMCRNIFSRPLLPKDSSPSRKQYLSVSESWIRKLVLRNILSGVEVINGVRYIRIECVDEYLLSISPPEGYLSADQAHKYYH